MYNHHTANSYFTQHTGLFKQVLDKHTLGEGMKNFAGDLKRQKGYNQTMK